MDSDVLIAAAVDFRGSSKAAVEISLDGRREFARSVFQEVAVLPAARRNGRKRELGWYQAFLRMAKKSPHSYEEVGQMACQIVAEQAIRLMDALHLASALAVSAEQLVTLESIRKGIAKTGVIEVLCLRG